jgi:spermidine synthase
MYVILTFIFASLSLLYEFSLSQMLTSLTGSSYRNYSLIIGLYTACLGFGSFYYDKYIQKKNISILLYTEILLSITALLAPIYILVLFSSYLSFMPSSIILILSLVPVVIIGLLSGIELPALIYASNESSHKILFADFFGMFVSSIIFYNLILAYYSVFQIIFFLSLCNTLCCPIILYNEKIPPKLQKIFISLITIVTTVALFGLFFHEGYLTMAQGLFLK